MRDQEETMGFTRLTQTYQPHSRGLCALNVQHAALSSAIYTISSSVLVVAIYCWRVAVNALDPQHLQDVYYGVQISYVSTIVTHITLVALSSSMLIGVCQERVGLVAPWVVANIAFMALEAVCCMYSNVLRDHINKKFDGIFKAEIIFFSTRIFINVFCLWSVMRFLRNIRAGVTYKEPEAIEL